MKRISSSIAIAFILFTSLVAFQNCSSSFSALSSQAGSTVTAFGKAKNQMATQNLYQASIDNLSNSILISPTQAGTSGQFFFTQFSPSILPANNQTISSYSFSHWTNLTTNAPGAQLGVSNATFGSSGVQYENGEFGINLNSADFTRPDGLAKQKVNLSTSVWFSQSDALQPFPTTDSVMQFSADFQVPFVALSSDVVAYSGMGGLFQDTTSNGQFFFSSILYDSRGSDYEFLMLDSGQDSTGLAQIEGRLDGQSEYLQLDPSSSPFQGVTWTGYKHFAYNVDAPTFVAMIRKLKTQYPATYANLSENPSDYRIINAGFGPEMGFLNPSLTSGSAGWIGVSFKNFQINRLVANPNRSAHEAYVRVLYRGLIGRDPSSDEIDGWTNAIVINQLTCAETAGGFYSSAEFQQETLNNTSFVAKLYEGILQRDPDSGGLANWVAALDNGMSRDQVYQQFVGSPEFASSCSSRFGFN